MKTILTFFVSLLIAYSGGASAQSNRVDTDYASSIFVPEKTALVPGETTWFAFSQRLEPGWHVYWKNPGDSGLPLDIRWNNLPEGVTVGEIVYPTPERIPVGPLANFGHHGDPVFLIPIKIDASVPSNQSLTFTANATWLICEEICVPEDGVFTFSLPVSETSVDHTEGSLLVRQAIDATPRESSEVGVYETTAQSMTIKVAAPDGLTGDVFFFPELEGLIEPAAEQIVQHDGATIMISLMPGFAYDPDMVAEFKGVISTADKVSSNAIAVVLAKASGVVGASGANTSSGEAVSAATGNLPLLLAAAFLGGVLLNIMPCVFPIIFIKAASLIKSAQTNRTIIRRHGMLYTGGVVATFAILGGALLFLRAGGEQLGWGFHLQSPLIVALSTYVLFLVGLNLAGVFEIGESLQSVGGNLADKEGDSGAFFTGALAVVVAAPCIGPFLSAPMGAAVFLPTFWGMLIFIMMALGLAAPYLLLSFAPGLGRYLPKPGAWMNSFKQLLSFPVFAAAAYFLWVLAQQTGGAGLARGLIGAITLAFAAWLFQQGKNDGPLKNIVKVGAALALIAGILPITGLKPASVAIAEGGKHGSIPAIAYDETMISSYRSEGRPVFIDFTAAWCVTCQFNKLTIFSKPALAEAFDANNVAFMVADWTTRDEKITKALEQFGANGVPLYVYYPQSGEPRILSLPLTEKAVLETLDG